MSISTQQNNEEAANTIDTNLTGKTLHHKVVIVGGGAAGITVAAQLLKKDKSLDVAIIEPSDKHYYQAAWTLVGGGQYKPEDTVKNEKDCIPKGATWIRDFVTQLAPDQNLVITREGTQVYYDYLVLCPGIQIDWHLIKGLREALGKDGVCSNYAYQYAPYTWECIQNFRGGNAIFTFPATPIKCGGAPQKIMYMADDIYLKNRVRHQSNVILCTAAATMFIVKEYSDALDQVVQRRGIDVKFKHNLKEIKPATKQAVFDVTTEWSVEEVTLKYDVIHVAPPMSAPDFIKSSKLAAPDGPRKGWVDVHKDTLQHNVYPNVFGLGDASSLPTSKTAAAIRKQAPVLVENLLSVMASNSLNAKYGGYTCCPLITGYGKTILAEFDYTNKPTSTFPLDPTQERYVMWLLKRHALPWVYWNRMLKGKPFEGDLLKLGKQRTN